MDWADNKMLNEKWSPEALLGHAKKDKLFPESNLACVTTLYMWIDRGVIWRRGKALIQVDHSDNGLEFSSLEEALTRYLQVYYCHPYSSWERGSSENQHKLIRRFIPKGRRIDSVSDTQLLRVQQWMNDYPRKILHFDTAHERQAA